ncbi:hypothetical protein SPRG_02778 [Saprolegnia parasitica CBS 223.65]|uniref:Uncharacterized protein n=1 Tax=Saprolegnia parasitica (strain CBS 223.65) TaxID=695850 RepID=A0A067CNN9_SAPPC|nr:hypothetical protein SPRG_02778 [Saprolegnia parasitica CBS 223.65]KDO32299.1 hypothetical protein SPRG_02778 [Saprolegnia parasitica CBS 223.65]|eukprot:XP_012196755.1 hypothetical protein SPRG_02778 [Saprolegnia parasitica CBS 223.65]
MHAPTLLLASLLATAAAATNNSVILPNDEHTLQYTRVAFENLPTCASNTWDIAGPQYDTYSRCTTKPDVILGINVFRCRKYAATAKTIGSDNVYNCDECFYGYRRIGPGGPQEIEPLTLDGYKAHNLTELRGYFVPQIIRDRDNLRSCFLTEGKNLGDLCASIERDSFGQADGADATCILKEPLGCGEGSVTSLPFAAKLQDDDNCHAYAIENRQVVCTARA